jgi:hypothetical protein
MRPGGSAGWVRSGSIGVYVGKYPQRGLGGHLARSDISAKSLLKTLSGLNLAAARCYSALRG